MESKQKKKSLIKSSLISTGGLFIAKLLGLAYTIPLSAILASDAYLSYYGTAYRIYSYILSVFTAGFPSAIATLVAMYMIMDDEATVLKIKNIAVRFLVFTGILGMIIMTVMAGVFAPVIAGSQDASIMRICLICLGVAMLFVPVLSAYRGYCQGLDEMKEYAFSQTFEQIFRVGFLLSVSCLLVYGFHVDRVWALYASVSSAAVAALAGLFQIARFVSVTDKPIRQRAQGKKGMDTKSLFKEFLKLSIPYLLVSMMGYIDDPLYSILLPYGLNHSGYTTAQVDVILNAVNFVGTKLTAIPMILAPGFTAALIPHISAALADHDTKTIRKNIIDCLNIVLYIGLPVSFCIFLYARPVYYTLFYTENLDLASRVVQWWSVEGFLSTITPIVTTIMMALGMRKTVIKRLVVNTVLKLVLIIPLIYLFGYAGAVITSAIGCAYMIIANLRQISNSYHLSFKPVARRLTGILIGMALFWLAVLAMNALGLSADSGSRLLCFVKLAVNGIVGVGIYLLVTWQLGLPQSIFHLKRKKHA